MYNWGNSRFFVSSSKNASRDSGLQHSSFRILRPQIRIFRRCFVCGVCVCGGSNTISVVA